MWLRTIRPKLSFVFALQFNSTCERRNRSARPATVNSGSGAAGIGSSPRLMRSMTGTACRRAVSAEISPWRPRVTRFGPAGPLVCTQ